MGHLYEKAGEIADTKCCEEMGRVSGVVLDQFGKEGTSMLLCSLLLPEIICYLNGENVPYLHTVNQEEGSSQ